jgi:asparagine synthase (glutamine-hydrolysing)
LVYNQGSATLMKFMDEKLENEFVLMQEIDSITREFGIKIKQPFLSPDFISLSRNIPIDQKINGPNDLLRKHILREVAVSMNVPHQSAMQPKKALQYSSGIHKNFCKVYRG